MLVDSWRKRGSDPIQEESNCHWANLTKREPKRRVCHRIERGRASVSDKWHSRRDQMRSRVMTDKKAYEQPKLRPLGTLKTVTLASPSQSGNPEA